MSSGFVDQRTDIADILSSTASNGEIRVNLGDSRDSTGFWPDAPMWGLDGFYSRPNDPDADGAAQAFFINDANENRVLASRDNRFADKVGSMDPGDRAIVTSGDARIFIKQVRDAITLYTVSQPDDDNMLFDMSGKDGVIKITCGAAWIEMNSDSITLSAGGSSIAIDKDGITIVGAHFGCSTASGHLGAPGPPPAPGYPVSASAIGFVPYANPPAPAPATPSKNWSVAP